MSRSADRRGQKGVSLGERTCRPTCPGTTLSADSHFGPGPTCLYLNAGCREGSEALLRPAVALSSAWEPRVLCSGPETHLCKRPGLGGKDQAPPHLRGLTFGPHPAQLWVCAPRPLPVFSG